MGFIEDLRRKMTEEDGLRERLRLAKQNQEIDRDRQQGEQREAALLEEERLKVLRGEAERHFQKSGLLEMITEVSKLGGGSPWNYGDSSGGIYKCGIVITREKVPNRNDFGDYGRDDEYGGVIISKVVSIEVDAFGSIKFKGGIFGSSTVRLSAWEKNRGVLEKALGRAYVHPKSEKSRYYPPSSNRDGPGIGSY